MIRTNAEIEHRHTSTIECPVCDKPMLHRNIGNHLRQKHSIPVPSHTRAEKAVEMAVMELQRRGGSAPVAVKKRQPAVNVNGLNADDVVASVASVIYDGGQVPVGHLRALFDLQEAVRKFMAEVSR